MLRIREVTNGPLTTTLHVEGRIISSWVSVLEGECNRLLRAPGGCIRLDLSAVIFVDDRGVLVLQCLATRGIDITNAPPLIEALLRGERAP